ncbi:hypothetical protein PC116_g2055 [Phytophthora cactorum]|uniref:Uncharacterized protein n=1 Tax=Phytophthora cactorum TaxID=29920 RepID=A0A8T0ZCL1_9STRA|nr:hypothetical protein PC111_g10466 [Phytophthora cactorum]KAG2829258.1 hypothetical protein PC112_g8156 [Phytophthora cactorum]KAG2859983.1 hypothetical protein PC113_g8426 [Phytophthora cactorum]KAG2913058.1 hypothetical protein PC114_g8655 [Phytophthora cactorum]KAG2954307.1 hypothetical protein PC117_g1301 [Phytophthora cactorum]
MDFLLNPVSNSDDSISESSANNMGDFDNDLSSDLGKLTMGMLLVSPGLILTKSMKTLTLQMSDRPNNYMDWWIQVYSREQVIEQIVVQMQPLSLRMQGKV